MGEELICLCREVDKETGDIAVYPIRAKVTSQCLLMLNIRSRVNPELRYYVTLLTNYDANKEAILKRLKRKRITAQLLAALNMAEI